MEHRAVLRRPGGNAGRRHGGRRLDESGGRPASVAAPIVEVALDDEVIGTATPIDEVRPYTLAIPPALAARLAAKTESVRLRLRVPTWNPGAVLGVNDTRDLGVIVTRVEVHTAKSGNIRTGR